MIAITKSATKDKIDKYILALIIVQYIEDITHGCAEIQNFPSSVEKYFMSERSEGEAAFIAGDFRFPHQDGER